ncbi:MAG: spondin domain-containing protein [Gammaproteobacteria bacterium]
MAEAGVIQNSDNGDSTGNNFESLLESSDAADENTWQVQAGLLAPSTTSEAVTFDTEDFPYLSLLTMLIPTNDAFAGLDSLEIPTTPGTYTYTLNAYDAGTELNDEINPAFANNAGVTEAGTGSSLGGYGVPGLAGAPTSDAVGTGASGVAAQIDSSNQVIDGTDGPVHIHRNVLGDTNASGGISDLDATVHRWLNPVARITITVPAN